MKKIIITICCIWLSLFLTEIIFADTLMLKNGSSFEGIVIEKTDEEVLFQVGIGTVTFAHNKIDKIIKDTESKNRNLQQDWHKQQIRHLQALKKEEVSALPVSMKNEVYAKNDGYTFHETKQLQKRVKIFINEKKI